MKEKIFCSWVALFTSVMTLITFIIAVSTPPLSGPFCRGGCYQYPYLDIVSRYPRDYYWMFPAIVFMVAYLVMMICLQSGADIEEKIFGRVSTTFASISTTVLLIAYFSQISVIQPSLLNSETDGISILSQFNPHGLFIVLEELGFITMSISFLFAGLTFSGKSRFDRWIRWIFIGSFILTMLSLAIITTTKGLDREYLFEIASITITWFTLIVNGFLIYKFYKKQYLNLQN